MFKKWNRKIILVICGIIILCVMIPLILDKWVFGNNVASNLSNSDWSSFLGSYIGGIVGGIATLSAIIISLNISRKIQMESELRENSLIVYYDLVLGLADLKKLYMNCRNSNYKNIPTRMFFSDEWIKNIARISGNIRDIDKMYKLYGDLEMISEEIKSKSEFQTMVGLSDDFDDDRYKRIIITVSEKIFSREFLDCDMKKYIDKEEIELDIYKDLNKDFMKIIVDLKFTKNRYMH